MMSHFKTVSQLCLMFLSMKLAKAFVLIQGDVSLDDTSQVDNQFFDQTESVSIQLNEIIQEVVQDTDSDLIQFEMIEYEFMVPNSDESIEQTLENLLDGEYVLESIENVTEDLEFSEIETNEIFAEIIEFETLQLDENSLESEIEFIWSNSLESFEDVMQYF